MPLIKCSDCGKEISDTASKCNFCGSIRTPINKNIVKMGKFIGSVGLTTYTIFALLLILLLFLFKSSSAIIFSILLLIIWIVWIKFFKKRIL